MEKNKDAYINYVCPYCWNTLDNCTCEIFPPYHLVFIDRGIQEHIRTLNEKEYKTIGCCEGHKEVCTNTYLAFANDYLKDIDMPDGFKYDKKRRMVVYTYPTRITEEELEEMKKETLAILLKWCKDLPNRA